MGDRTPYWVISHGNEWAVKLEGENEVMQTFSSHEDAREEAIRLAKEHTPSEIKVQGEDGNIVERQSYD
ncbi:DUF2188 domain-containing protein [Thiohalorhabdus methylotrophus]|uniref:DUF2188 domain-containing protein n=1 Tax=Thiohalorhabdus methylotrophus TaxID=3242694 RepID=A0ABV4TYG1_9GAMM